VPDVNRHLSTALIGAGVVLLVLAYALLIILVIP
jgi:hypothetical protein